MSRKWIGIAGLACAAGGIALVLGAHSLATTWQQLGPSAWGGETDVHQESLYRTLGFVLLPFGLVLITLVAYCSLNCARCAQPDSRSPSAV